jgi:hypothetical protein
MKHFLRFLRSAELMAHVCTCSGLSTVILAESHLINDLLPQSLFRARVLLAYIGALFREADTKTQKQNVETWLASIISSVHDAFRPMVQPEISATFAQALSGQKLEQWPVMLIVDSTADRQIDEAAKKAGYVARGFDLDLSRWMGEDFGRRVSHWRYDTAGKVVHGVEVGLDGRFVGYAVRDSYGQAKAVAEYISAVKEGIF